MTKVFGSCLLCAVWISAAGAETLGRAETFVIAADETGHEATVKIPVGAVTKLSANFAESLVGYADPQIEAMRLSGDVLISIAGSEQPIQIKADKLVLELTADSAPGRAESSRSDAANKSLRSTTAPAAGSQVFVGNVVFNLRTPCGPMEIKAERVEHQVTPETGA